MERCNSFVIRLCLGGLQSVRFTFVTADNGWNPSEDAYAAFNREKSNLLFIDGSWVEYSSEKEDYTWNVIKHERNKLKFTGWIKAFLLFIQVCKNSLQLEKVNWCKERLMFKWTLVIL